MSNEIDYQAEGLLDGVIDDAGREARARLLDYLIESERVPLDELKLAAQENRLVLLPLERALGGDPKYTAAEVAEKANVDLKVFLELRRSLGLAEPGVGRDHGEVAEVRLAQDEPVAEAWTEPCEDSGDGRPIGVETEEAAIRVVRLQDPLGVPTAAQGGVDLKAARGRREHQHDLLRQHRQVLCLHLSSIPNERIPSGPWKRM